MKQTENQVTIWGDPAETFQSEYGRIRYDDWCHKEAARMARQGISFTVVTDACGWVAVMKEEAK